MDSDEGPSVQLTPLERKREFSRPFSLSNKSSYKRLKDVAEQNVGLAVSDRPLEDIIVDAPAASPKILKSAVETPKARPLDLTDDFEIVIGVPTFTWKYPLRWTPFHIMALSSDKTRIATVEKAQKICIYDVLDNFALIAESDRCFKRVNCVAFIRGQNDLVTVVHENSKVSFLLMLMANLEVESQNNVELWSKTLAVIKEHCVLPQCNYHNGVFSLIASHATESWVFASDPNAPNELNLISVSKEDYHKVKIITDDGVRSRATFMSIPQKAFMSVVENESNNRTRKTWIWKRIYFEEEVIRRRPIEIEGQYMELSDCGKYFLVWGDQQRRQSTLGLYDIETLEEDSPRPMSSTLLPANIMDVKAKFFNRNSIELSDVDLPSDESIPSVAFLMTRKNKVFLSFWDPHKDEIFKKMDFTARTMVWSAAAELQFCLSPNMKWIVIGGWSKGRFALFSVVSKRLVWDADLLDEELAAWPYSAFEFDASCTKLIVNCSNRLYAFAPPCLIEDYRIEVRGARYELKANSNCLLSPLTWEHRRLLSKELLHQLMVKQLNSRLWGEYITCFDAALSKISQMVAMLLFRLGRFMLLVGSLDDFSTNAIKDYFQADDVSSIVLEDITVTNTRKIFVESEIFKHHHAYYVFLYPDQERREDNVVTFATNKGLSAAFKDSSNTWTKPLLFSEEKCFQIRQSNAGHRVICIMHHGAMIIDLNKREKVHVVNDVGHVFLDWIYNFTHGRKVDHRTSQRHRSAAILDIAMDRTERVCVRQNVKDFSVADEIKESPDFSPCAFHIGYSCVGYMETTNSKSAPNVLVVKTPTRFILKEESHRRITNDQWNPHTRKMINAIFGCVEDDYTLVFDDSTGHFWAIGIKEEGLKSNVVFVPFGPFSLDKCVPNLYMKNYPADGTTMTELESMVDNFGASFFTMTFNGKTNCDIALQEKDMNTAWKILHVAGNNEVNLAIERREDFQAQGDNRLELAIDGNDYGWVNACLDITINDMSTSQRAFAIKKCFEKLWTNFRSLAISLCERDVLVSNVCDLEIYDNILNMENFLQARVGTCHSIEEWMDASSRGASFSHWRSCHAKHAIRIERRGVQTKTKATLKVFYVDDVCKVGLNGIIRFLLMHNVPSYIFKSSLIKWVIIYKWETIWRKRSIRNFIIYLFYIGSFSAYTICIGYYGESLKNVGVTWSYIFILLCVTCSMALYMTYKEVIQLITCCRDGKELFENCLYGFQSYFSSPWNMLEVMSYIMLLVVFCLHVMCLYGASTTLPILYTCSAVEVLFMWMKIWYFAQPFKKTGALVLLVENVIRDCVPFLLLTLGVLTGFGIAMYGIFQSILYKLDFEEDNETKIAIDQGFGNPIRSMLTLFYAMVGMFDPMFLFDCGFWSILVIAIFVSYLSIQMILMLNMLIALMGDTFDRVKNTEEEQLLLGRARFIDACEAQLTRKQIENIEKNVDKWLYVILPNNQNESEEVKQWQGRVKTIEDRVEKMIKDSQAAIISEIKEDNNNKVTNLRNEMEMLKSNDADDMQSLKKMIKECFLEIKKCFAEISGESST